MDGEMSAKAAITTSIDQNRSGTSGFPRNQDAESLFRTKSISEIRNVEAATRKQIQDKSEELRQLVGNRYRDLIDSADSIVLMKSSCESISANISAIHNSVIHSLSSPVDSPRSPYVSINSAGAHIYGIACRVKYLVDTPENIWGCLDGSMFLESAARYFRAKHVHFNLLNCKENKSVLSNFPLLQHQWQIVEGFKSQISQRSRERLLDQTLNLGINAYADALAAVAIIDELEPMQVLTLFLDLRKSCMFQKLSACCHDVNADSSDVISVFCDVLKIIQVSVGQVGELFLQVLNDMPLFYKTTLGSPPASQLFGGIPNPDEEVRLWHSFRDKLESDMVLLGGNVISKTCSDWLRNCGKEIMSKISGRYLIDVMGSGYELSLAEKLIRETIDSKQFLAGSLDWLKTVFGSDIELPWKRTRELVLGEDSDLWDDIFEDAFVQRMKAIIALKFDELSDVVDVVKSVQSIVQSPSDQTDAEVYFNSYRNGGGVWFTKPNGRKLTSVTGSKLPQENDPLGCLNSYFGTEVSQIKDTVDSRCQTVLEDLISFLNSPKASFRVKDLVPHVQNKCFESLSVILAQLKSELERLHVALENGNKNGHSTLLPTVHIEKSLFIGRLSFAFQKHSKHIPVILGSPRSWISEFMMGVTIPPALVLRQNRVAIDSPKIESTEKTMLDANRKQASLATAALYGVDDRLSPQLEDFKQTIQDLCVRAYNLWISWISDELSKIFSVNLKQDDALTSNTPVRGWEETVVKQQELSSEGQSEMKIFLPSMPSLYVTSFLFYACEEVHRVGGHVLDKQVLQNFASMLLDKVVGIYGEFLSSDSSGSQVSEKGVLQILLDLKFITDFFSGGDFHAHNDASKLSKVKAPPRRKREGKEINSVIRERTNQLVNRISHRLDPIDWLTYEPYLWENKKQACLRHAVLFGFFVQLNRFHVDTVQKLPTNSESNLMRCSTVPRFKYLPISAPALSARNSDRTSMSASVDDVYSRNTWRSYANDEVSRNTDDENSSLGVAAPFLKSFMQVGSRFGESTLRLGSMLTDGQVGRFGDILPAQAAGLLSSFSASRLES